MCRKAEPTTPVHFRTTRSVSTGEGTFEYNDQGAVDIRTALYTVVDGYYGDTYTFYLSDDPDLREKPASGNYITVIARATDFGKEFNLAENDYSAGWEVRHNDEQFIDVFTAATGSLKITRDNDGTVTFAVNAFKENESLKISWTGQPADLNALPKEELAVNTYEADNRLGEVKHCFVAKDPQSGTNTYYVMASQTAAPEQIDDAVFTIKLQSSDEGGELDIAEKISLATGEFIMFRPQTSITDGTLCVKPSADKVTIDLSNAAGTIRLRYEGVCETIEPSSGGDPITPSGWTYAFGAIGEASYLPSYKPGTTLFTFYRQNEGGYFELEVADSYLQNGGEYTDLKVNGGGDFFELRCSFYDEDTEDYTTFSVSNTSGGVSSLGTPSGDLRLKFIQQKN